MRTLIDGYNLMYASGLLGPRHLGPEGFRKARKRFLNDLVAGLDPVEAHQTTVVFDASAAPDHLPSIQSFKGIEVIFAVADEDADARIERLISQHSTPKDLTVVSSDHRVRQAATRRKAKVLTAESFLDQLDAHKRKRPSASIPKTTAEDRAREQGLGPDEAAFWHEEFRDLVDDPETRDSLRSAPEILTDAEIAQLEREIEKEFNP
jgi:predicted RNA-binding protein with PIN domain